MIRWIDEYLIRRGGSTLLLVKNETDVYIQYFYLNCQLLMFIPLNVVGVP